MESQVASVSSRVAAVLEAAMALSPRERWELMRQLLLTASAFADSGLRLAAFIAPTDSAASGAYLHGSETLPVPLRGIEDVFGCPWCRRPLCFTFSPASLLESKAELVGVEQCRSFSETPEEVHGKKARIGIAALPDVPEQDVPMTALPRSLSQSESPAAICALLYGNSPKYFVGACVLGWGLLRHDSDRERVLVHTDDIPNAWLEVLEKRCGWRLHAVNYLKGSEQVARRLFHGDTRKNRFRDVFTKLQALTLPYDKVLLLDLDLLIRKAIGELLDLRVPAAMARGEPVPAHGAEVPYERFWDSYERRQWDGVVEQLPRHQQSSGINAGVMLLPGRSGNLLDGMAKELADWEHPEHYPSYMPEQEYLGRWCGTFYGPRAWSHISCKFNFELDKDRRVPFDFTAEHKRYKEDLTWGLENLAVAHFSGLRIKPWDVLFRYDAGGHVANDAKADEDQGQAGEALSTTATRSTESATADQGSNPHGYVGPPASAAEQERVLGWYDDALTKKCLEEWLKQFQEVFHGIDVLQLLGQRLETPVSEF